MVDLVLANAQKAIADRLSSLGVPADSVVITKGNPDPRAGVAWDDGSGKTSLNIAFTLPESLYAPKKLEQLRENFGSWEPTKNWEWHTNEQMSKDLKVDLEKIQNEVPGFDAKLMKWHGLDDKVAKRKHRLPPYSQARNVTTSYGITSTVVIPYIEGTDSKPILEKFAAEINEPVRNKEIKDSLTQRTVKYLNAKVERKQAEIADPANAEKLEEMQKDLTKLEEQAKNAPALMESLSVVAKVNPRNNGVDIEFRSPKQLKELPVGAAEWQLPIPNNVAELKAENPLHLLDGEITEEKRNPELHKAISRAVFFKKDKESGVKVPVDNFVEFAGRVNFRHLLATHFKKLEQTAPDKAPLFKKILESEYLKDPYLHELNNPNASHERADIKEVDGKVNEIIISLPIKNDDIKTTLDAMIAGQSPAAEQSQSPETVANDILAASNAQAPATPAASIASAGPTSLADRAKQEPNFASRA